MKQVPMALELANADDPQAGIKFKTNVETGEDEPWELKDLRKTCATYYDEHMPESSIEILGHSVGGITYRHYAHRASLAFKAIMTLPQPEHCTKTTLSFRNDNLCPRQRVSKLNPGSRKQQFLQNGLVTGTTKRTNDKPSPVYTEDIAADT